jgi:hypothetical protein
MMRGLTAVAVVSFLLAAIPAAQAPHAGPAAALTAAEQAEGWRLLFDGVSTKGWRGFKRPGFPTRGWVVESGWLKHLASGGQPNPASGDIITIDTFGDFDLRFQWRIAPGGNSGVMERR